MPTNIAIDIGNSSIKVGLFTDSNLVNDWVCESFEQVIALVKQHQAKKIILCTVSSDALELTHLLSAYELIILSASTPIPFNNHYKTKNTLGLDRIAALAGAEKINRNKNNLVIDVGSCITYDLLDKNHSYHGGSISPGIHLRFKSMNDYTKRLPLIKSVEREAILIGKTTEEAMISGVINGIAAELDGIISQYQMKWPDLEVIMCGRGLNSFESKLKAPIFASPKLVLIGLNRILEYNEQS